MENLKNILNNPNIKNSRLSLIFGKKVFDNCFDFNFSETKYLNFLRFIKNNEKWVMKSKKNLKIFYYYDLKLIADENTGLMLEKDIVTNFYDFLNLNDEGFRLFILNKQEKLDLNLFPGLDEIHDIRKIREIIFQKDDIYVKFMVVSQSNKDITFEIFIESKNHKQLIEEIPKFVEFFKIQEINKKTVININNTDNLSLTII